MYRLLIVVSFRARHGAITSKVLTFNERIDADIAYDRCGTDTPVAFDILRIKLY